MNIKHGSVKDRLLARAIVRPGCWGWSGSVTQGGYARMTLRGRMHRANRLSWAAHYGAIPDGLWVLHRCDNPLCINPEHLFLGTHADNVRDRDAKGRQARQRGEACGAAKLTAEDVQAIRADTGYRNNGALARHYGVSRPLISLIRTRKVVWQHLEV